MPRTVVRMEVADAGSVCHFCSRPATACLTIAVQPFAESEGVTACEQCAVPVNAALARWLAPVRNEVYREATSEDWRRAFASQQRHTDDTLADLRRYYESWSPEEKERIRTFLEKMKAVGGDGLNHDLFVEIRVRYDEYKEDAVNYDDADLEWMCNLSMSPHTMLQAIWHWDNGQPFTPPGAIM
jgi:hypothetical protein